ncbi:hypothetical protein [Arthrobacter sp. Edens01]|uniref:hypothetical protein n=1 Tax=Arthrobacter sp. Edens01 TaxID=1732020 RepID=UPI0006D9976C|nr:hypothetical protein [Arthrobacter sp. Edens01]KPN17845.1 hypothetical protein AO716_07865 [Arthrobacter sp. Edens01]
MDEVRAGHGSLRLETDGALTALDAAGLPAAAGSGLAADLTHAVLSGSPDTLKASVGELHVVRTALAAGECLGETPVPVDMTNLSVVVGGDKIIKLVRQWSGADRSARLLARLADAGVDSVPGYYGSLDWEHPEHGRGTLALLSAVIPDAGDGWTWAVDDVVAWFRGGKAPEFPAALGRLAAEVHAALLAGGAHPAPGAAEVRARADGVLDVALALTGGDAGIRLSNRAGRIREQLAAVPETAAPAFDLHGDLHVGQVLRSGEQYWLLDFDGDPQLPDAERDRPDSAARDVAHLAASLEMVASVAAKRLQAADEASLGRLYGWADEASVQLTGAYQLAAAEAGLPDLLDEAMLPGLIAEQLLRELIYAHRFLPRWQYAADGAITHRFARDSARAPRTKEPAWTPPAL